MRPPACTTIDFETLPIQMRPEYPPKPVSMVIKEWGKKGRAFLWGHPSGNNCSLADAKRALKAVWKPGKPLLFHHGKFDVDVAETHMGVPRLPSTDYHDNLFMSFLRDPHSPDLGLKPLAEKWLNWPPEERDAVEVWAKANRAHCLSLWHPGFKKDGKALPFKPGAYIGYAPGEIVEPYVLGDGDRTEKLFRDSWNDVINDLGMLEAYQREQKVMTIFLDNERVGMRVNMKLLRKDVKIYKAHLAAVEAWIRKKLKKPDLNIDADEEMAEALERAKQIKPEDWVITASGQRSMKMSRAGTGANLLPSMFKDQAVARALGYRNRLVTCLTMFMEPWLAQAEIMDGRISTTWNQVANPNGGTRTGRPSCTKHNLLNVAKAWGVDDGYEHPDHLTVDPLPLVRRYLLPDEGEQWLHRDYNGQELRILAHGEDGPLMQAYQEDPWLDVHSHVKEIIEEQTGKVFARKNVKIANFRIIYGGGAGATAAGIGCSLAEAKELLAAHAAALPSIKGRGGIAETTKNLGRSGEPVVTWGGRCYFVEPPGYSKKYKRHMTYEYKLLNYFCQGSAADITKQAMINYNEHPKRRGRFLAQVYDEMNSSSGPNPKAEMAVLRESMECVSEQLDVPMLSEGKIGPSWGDQKAFEEPPSAYAGAR